MSDERPLLPWLLPSFALALLLSVAGWLLVFGVRLPFGPSWLPGALFALFGALWIASAAAARLALGPRGILALAPMAPMAFLAAAYALLWISR